MKRFMTLFAILVLACGAAFAQSEAEKMRFEVTFSTGFPTVLSGPDLSDTSSYCVRFGYYPTENFQLTLSYDRVDNDVAPDDILNSYFAEVYRNSVASNVNFNDALLKDSTVDIEQWELGLVKAIPLGESKHFETYIGIAAGIQTATGQFQWEGATKRILEGPNAGQSVPVDAVLPSEYSEESGEFFIAVRGGVNWTPLKWLVLQCDLRVVPIDSVYEQSLNTLELNFGVGFRFGKF